MYEDVLALRHVAAGYGIGEEVRLLVGDEDGVGGRVNRVVAQSKS
jgi:hypothetical protein